jgi:hypothetical protein
MCRWLSLSFIKTIYTTITDYQNYYQNDFNTTIVKWYYNVQVKSLHILKTKTIRSQKQRLFTIAAPQTKLRSCLNHNPNIKQNMSQHVQKMVQQWNGAKSEREPRNARTASSTYTAHIIAPLPPITFWCACVIITTAPIDHVLHWGIIRTLLNIRKSVRAAFN